MSTSSGTSKVKIGSPSSSTMSVWIRTMWQPLSMSAAFFKEKVTVGLFVMTLILNKYQQSSNSSV
jgi:hypothetical protein